MTEQNHRAPKNEEQEELKKKLRESITRSRNQPKNLKELGASVAQNLPANLSMTQNFMKVVNWKKSQEEVLENLQQTIVLVGQPNSGKSTLFNKMKGQLLSEASPVAGTTKNIISTDFGPFRLLDTPGHLPDVMKEGMDQASVIILLIDATRGLRTEDKELFDAIKKTNKPTIVVANKVDLLKNPAAADQFATEVALLLNVYGVIPVSAVRGTNIAEELIPAIIDASPEAALVIGNQLPGYRRQAAQKIIRNSALISLAAGVEPIPFIDIPILLGTQIRLVLRLAALYGEPLDKENALLHARELIATIAGGAGMRYLAQQAAKFVPFGGDFIAGAIAGAATWSIGQVALEYYAHDKQIAPKKLRALYSGFLTNFKKNRLASELKKEAEQEKRADELQSVQNQPESTTSPE